MKKIYTTLLTSLFPLLMMAQGWPANYGGVMLQGFYWDSFDASKWTKLESQADELSQYFNLVWIPQSASCGGTSMGYDDLYWFTNYNSSFGTEAELRSLISTFKGKGIGTIADVVINHRKTLNSWVDFPSETYKGVTYQLQSTDICSNDDGGKTKTWADANGYSLSSNNDSGEGWDGMRDLDHNSTNVQTSVKAYLNMLLNDLGYAGFRYDMVKGYSGSFTGLYNSYANPTYSVGEYWDGNASTVETWLNNTKVDSKIQSAAFDFPFRYTVRDAINNSDWTKLSNTSVMSDVNYRQYAVTFVENHDTEYRSSSAQQDPIRKDTLAANAFLIAMPGTPCVFYRHWIDCKQSIKAMIDARKLAGITNTSTYVNFRSSTKYLANTVTGSNGKLLVVVGDVASMTAPSTSTWTKILSGYHYAYYLSNTLNTAWADKASGEYNDPFDVTLSTVSENSGATLVYTTDGSTPTASSTSVTSGTSIKISTACTLKVGLLINGIVSGIITRTYTFNTFEPYTITVYVNADAVNWSSPINYWTWGGDGTHAPTNTSWPGDKVSATKTINGKTWYYKTYTINSNDDVVNFVFSTGSGSPQTVDITGINKDAYFEISTTTDNSKYKVNDVTSTMTGINTITSDKETTNNNVYAIDGRQVRSNVNSADALQGLSKGIYIVNGKKYVVK
jgi:alpha-amylase